MALTRFRFENDSNVRFALVVGLAHYHVLRSHISCASHRIIAIISPSPNHCFLQCELFPQFQSRFQSHRHLPSCAHVPSVNSVCARVCALVKLDSRRIRMRLTENHGCALRVSGWQSVEPLPTSGLDHSHHVCAALCVPQKDEHSSRLAYAQQRQPSDPQPLSQPPSLPPRPHQPSAPTSSSPSDSSSPSSASNASDQSRSLLLIMLASATSGALARIPLHPIDTIKAKLQTLPSSAASAASSASAGIASGATLAAGAAESVAKPSAFGLVRATFRAEVLRAQRNPWRKNVTRLALFDVISFESTYRCLSSCNICTFEFSFGLSSRFAAFMMHRTAGHSRLLSRSRHCRRRLDARRLPLLHLVRNVQAVLCARPRAVRPARGRCKFRGRFVGRGRVVPAVGARRCGERCVFEYDLCTRF